MKNNKLRTFFIIGFILLLIPFSIAKIKVPSRANSNITITYPPTTNAGISYLSFFNKVENYGTIITAFRGNNYVVVFSDENKTYFADFNSSGYKISEKVILDTTCRTGLYHNGKIILISGDYEYTLDKTGKLETKVSLSSLNIENCYKITNIDGKLTYFCIREQKITTFEQKVIISHPKKCVLVKNNIYFFLGDGELYITDFDKSLCFEVDEFISGDVIGEQIFFCAKAKDNYIVSQVEDFSVTFTTVLDEKADNALFEKQPNGINIYSIKDVTYKYFVCNHGDIINKSLFSQNALVSLSSDDFIKDGTITFFINDYKFKTPLTFYNNCTILSNNFVFFESYDFETFETGIYFGKLKNM